MKKLILGMSTVMGLSPLAQADFTEGQFPVLKTEKSCDINVPPGLSKSQVYFSKDCSTAFVLPAQRIQAEVSDPVYLAGSQPAICRAFHEQVDRLSVYMNKIDELATLRNTILSSAPRNQEEENFNKNRILAINEAIETYKKDFDDGLVRFDSMPALRIKYILSNNLMESLLAFQTANLIPGNTGAGSIYPVRFMPAPLGSSTLVISNPEADKFGRRMVTRSNFPGFISNHDSKYSQDPNAQYVAMNGGLSGIVDISASAFCSTSKDGEPVKDVVARSVALNLYYDVKVQTGVKLYVNATIQTKDFLRQLSNMKLKAKYERREFTNDIINGGLQNTILISLDDKGEPRELQALLSSNENNPVGILVSQVLSKYVDRVQDKLEQLGVFAKVDSPRAPEVANGTDSVVTGYSEVCRSNRGFFGIGASRSCSRQPIIVQMDRTAISQLALSQQDDSYIKEEVLFETNSTNTILHSSTFTY